jgi:uncharacterized protein (TIGR02145 family)
MKTKIKTLCWGMIPVVLSALALLVTSCQRDEYVNQEEFALKSATISAVTPVVYPDVFVGPETFTFSPVKGKLQTQTVTLTNADYASFEPAMALVIQNGNGNGSNTVRSANIFVNGTQVVGAADFRKAPGIFSKEITGLTESTTIKVEVKGSTMGSLTVWIEGTVPLSQTTFTDSRDGHVYNMVKIFNQVWMAENLAYLPSVNLRRDGSTTDPRYYVYGYDGTDVTAAKATSNYSTYGALYNWPGAMTACPEGWHLPSFAEWTTLKTYLGGESVAGGKMKETGTTHWLTPNTGATNESGFMGLPGGYRAYADITGQPFLYVGELGMWWSSTEDLSKVYASAVMLDYNSANLSFYGDQKDYGRSVRCVRND